MNTFTAAVVQAQTKNNGRIVSLAMAALLTVAMLASVNGLAVMDSPAPQLAHTSTSSGHA